MASIPHASAMALHDILGQGDEDTWKKLCEHEHSFLFAAVDQSNSCITSLHELVWCRTKARARATGATGWVLCRQNGAHSPLGLIHPFRIHLCRQCPCTAVYPASKYGDVPPPARHGKIVRLCERGEIVSMESEWNSLLGKIEGASAVTEPPSAVTEAPSLDGGYAMSEPPSAVTETAPRGSKRKLSGDAQVLQDEVVSGDAQGFREPTSAEGGGTSPSLDGGYAMSEPASAVSERAPRGSERTLSGDAQGFREPTSALAGESHDAQAFRMAILARADEISVAGAWIGVLEIMAFCAMNKQRVVVQMEEGTFDPIADLAPRLIDKTWNMEPFCGRLVMCRMVGRVWQTACWKTCTH